VDRDTADAFIYGLVPGAGGDVTTASSAWWAMRIEAGFHLWTRTARTSVFPRAFDGSVRGGPWMQFFDSSLGPDCADNESGRKQRLLESPTRTGPHSDLASSCIIRLGVAVESGGLAFGQTMQPSPRSGVPE